MKYFPTPMDVMQTMFQYIADAYLDLPRKEKGIIQFCLHEDHQPLNCYFLADGQAISFIEGVSETWNVRLESSLQNWVELAGGKLNPIVGVILGKLKFSGDVSFFGKIISKNLYAVNLNPYLDPITEFEANPAKHWERPRNVLLLDASPRGNNGYTRLYSNYIENTLTELGVQVNHVVLAQYKINPCSGCLQCWLKNEGHCAIKDDVSQLYEWYEQADLVIYAFPLFAYGVPGMLKNFLDRGVMRQYPYFEKGQMEIRHPRREKTNKAFVVFSICGFPSFSQFDAVKSFFRLYSNSSHSPLVGEIYRPGGIFLLQNPFSYFKLKRFLEVLKIALTEIVELGMIRQSTKRNLLIKVDQKVFLESTNKYWDNLYKRRDMHY